jgi:CubicO group peptidase (beta-lactamase class C family)
LFAPPASGQTPDVLEAIEEYVHEERARFHIPGLSIAVLRGDSLVFALGYGYANVELQALARDSTVYQSGSVSKQFTAAGILMLSEQGRLSLDDPITKFLPEGQSAWRTVMIRHLLTHTSGIPDYGENSFDWRRDYTEDELVRLVAIKPLEFSPGDRWSYSSTGYVLLGIIIHRVTGMFYGDVLRQHYFEPLGMGTARVNSDTDIVLNRAAGYHFVGDTLKNQDWISPSLRRTADGGLDFSVLDLAQWAIALNHGTVVGQNALEESWTPVRLNRGGSYPYGFGWHLAQQRGFRRIGHTGAREGFRATIQRYPEFDLTIIVMTNLAQSLPETIALGIAGLLEPRLTPPHLLQQELSVTPPESIDDLLHDIAGGSALARLSPGLKLFITDDMRERLRQRISPVLVWESVGCDDVRDRSISRLGTRIRWICYSKGEGAVPSLLVTVLYGADWRAASIDLYSF